MDLEAIRNKVKDFATEAVKSDKLEEYEKAYDLYVKAAEQLKLLIKNDQNTLNVKIYKEREKDYILRAKNIKENIKKMRIKDYPAHPPDADPESESDKKVDDKLMSVIDKKNPNVKWDDIVGLEKAKKILKEAIILPIKFPHLFKGKRKPWKSILLYGPPGTGKSLLAKAAATEVYGNYFFYLFHLQIL